MGIRGFRDPASAMLISYRSNLQQSAMEEWLVMVWSRHSVSSSVKKVHRVDVIAEKWDPILKYSCLLHGLFMMMEVDWSGTHNQSTQPFKVYQFWKNNWHGYKYWWVCNSLTIWNDQKENPRCCGSPMELIGSCLKIWFKSLVPIESKNASRFRYSICLQ